MHKLFNLIEGGIIGAALLIIFDHVVDKFRWPSYRKRINSMYSRTYYRPYATSYSIFRPKSKRFYGIVFDTRSQAENVLDKCIESIDIYGFCSVRDFKEYALDTLEKYIHSDYSDKYYVWKDLKNAKVRVTRLGYEIDFPIPEYKEEED